MTSSMRGGIDGGLRWAIILAVMIGVLACLGYNNPHWVETPEVSNYLMPTVTFPPSSTPPPAPEPTVSPMATSISSPTPKPTVTFTPSPTPRPTATITPSPTPTVPTFTPVPSPILTASPTVSATVASPLPLVDIPPCPAPSVSSHLWLARPIPPQANDWASTYYPYGSTAGGEYLIHHGVDLVNREGTPVLAAGSGVVWYAGDDRERVFGPQPDFYGQLVILKMDKEYHGQPLFTLYGHLSTIVVHKGQRVEVGQKLGEVGATGIALGPHLHFEVRVTDPEGYNATRNPELWLRPHSGRGIIAGKVLDKAGHPMPEVRLVLYPADDPEHPRREGWTYASQGVNPDEEWFENLVLSDVPAGEWSVVAQLPDQRLCQKVTVREGQISWVCLQPPRGPVGSSP